MPDRAGWDRAGADGLTDLSLGEEHENGEERLQRWAEERTGEEVEAEEIDADGGQDQREIRGARTGAEPCVERRRPIVQPVAHAVFHWGLRADEPLRPKPEAKRNGDNNDAGAEVAQDVHGRRDPAADAASRVSKRARTEFMSGSPSGLRTRAGETSMASPTSTTARMDGWRRAESGGVGRSR